VIAAPDLIEPVVGFRKWRLDEGGLRSPYVGVAWRAPVMHADCRRSSLVGKLFEQGWLEEAHEAPDPRCKCGIYAYHEPKSRASPMYLRSIWGIVTLWGRIEVHRDGMRAQHARLAALAISPEWSSARRGGVERLVWELGIDLVDQAELRRAAREYGHAVPAALVPGTP
jgi:hypothetical protein